LPSLSSLFYFVCQNKKKKRKRRKRKVGVAMAVSLLCSFGGFELSVLNKYWPQRSGGGREKMSRKKKGATA
jgi:hypothetical protein